MKQPLLGLSLALSASLPAFAQGTPYLSIRSFEFKQEEGNETEGGHGDLRGGHGDMKGGHGDMKTPFGGHGDMKGGHGDMRMINFPAAFDPSSLQFDMDPTALPSDLDLIELSLDKIINIGKKVWGIVEAGRPIVSVRTDNANAVPQGVSAWNQLEGWQTPKSVTYRAVLKNGYNMEVVNLAYRLIYTYGGNVKGKGQYLTNVTVVPASINVAWGYDLDVQVDVPSVLNVGSSESPVGGMELLVKWRVKTTVSHVERSQSFFVRGDGSFAELN
jgi:hypothetical protein